MRFPFAIFVAALIISLCSVQPAFAHATEPRLEINIDRIIPGGVIDVRGVAFDYEEIVTLTLLGAQSEFPLGEVVADTEGIFLQTVTLPSDLAEGIYYFRGVTTHHYTLSPALTVQGNAIPAEGEEEERWEEEEYLPYAIPTFPPGVVPGVVTASAPIATAVPVQAPSVSSGLSTNILILIGLMVLVVLVVIALGKKRAA